MSNASRSLVDAVIFMVFGALLLIAAMAINHMAVGTALAHSGMFGVEIGVVGVIAGLCLVYGFGSYIAAKRDALYENARRDFSAAPRRVADLEMMPVYSSAAILSVGFAIICLVSGMWCKLGPAGYLAVRSSAQLPLLIMSIVLFFAGWQYWNRAAKLVRS